jgi:hypothetical protein
MNDDETVLYEVVGHVATITMNRPEAANAQSSALIDGIDHFFDVADADDEVRVVILAGSGKHFSAGHDLKAIVGGEPDPWTQIRETPEGKFRHEQVMYYERCKRIYSFRKPTIAQVQGAAVAAGLMLACMCDLIVAAEDAVFSNPVLRMTGAGVELLVEPWERRPGSLAAGAGQPGGADRRVGRADEGAGRASRPGPPHHGAGHEGHHQQHGHPDGERGVLEVPLHGAPLDAQHQDGPRCTGDPQVEIVDERGLRGAP